MKSPRGTASAAPTGHSAGAALPAASASIVEPASTAVPSSPIAAPAVTVAAVAATGAAAGSVALASSSSSRSSRSPSQRSGDDDIEPDARFTYNSESDVPIRLLADEVTFATSAGSQGYPCPFQELGGGCPQFNQSRRFLLAHLRACMFRPRDVDYVQPFKCRACLHTTRNKSVMLQHFDKCKGVPDPSPPQTDRVDFNTQHIDEDILAWISRAVRSARCNDKVPCLYCMFGCTKAMGAKPFALLKHVKICKHAPGRSAHEPLPEGGLPESDPEDDEGGAPEEDEDGDHDEPGPGTENRTDDNAGEGGEPAASSPDAATAQSPDASSSYRARLRPRRSVANPPRQRSAAPRRSKRSDPAPSAKPATRTPKRSRKRSRSCAIASPVGSPTTVAAGQADDFPPHRLLQRRIGSTGPPGNHDLLERILQGEDGSHSIGVSPIRSASTSCSVSPQSMSPTAASTRGALQIAPQLRESSVDAEAAVSPTAKRRRIQGSLGCARQVSLLAQAAVVLEELAASQRSTKTPPNATNSPQPGAGAEPVYAALLSGPVASPVHREHLRVGSFGAGPAEMTLTTPMAGLPPSFPSTLALAPQPSYRLTEQPYQQALGGSQASPFGQPFGHQFPLTVLSQLALQSQLQSLQQHPLRHLLQLQQQQQQQQRSLLASLLSGPPRPAFDPARLHQASQAYFQGQQQHQQFQQPRSLAEQGRSLPHPW